MVVRRRSLAVCALAFTLLGGCAPQPRVATQHPPAQPDGAVTADAYKRIVARRIVQKTSAVHCEPMPEVMKSIVVLDITIDRDGNLLQASVYRSNGYPELESRALASVARAAPFAAPAPGLLEDATSLTFLETFLFRDDECFQIRSLAATL